MTNYFQRQLAYYANAHRDQVNSVMHMIGNPILFVLWCCRSAFSRLACRGFKLAPHRF
jgi:uncharacterized membrane protein YGL010W